MEGSKGSSLLAMAWRTIAAGIVCAVCAGCAHTPSAAVSPATPTGRAMVVATPSAEPEPGAGLAIALPTPTVPGAALATAQPTPAMLPDEWVTITILYDNVPFHQGIQTAWGYACLVRAGETVLLFDTGGDPELLLANMATLGVEPKAIDAVVLSHEHLDHSGGLAGLIAAGARPTVYVPAAFPDGLKANLASQTVLVEVAGAMEVAPGVWSTGQMGTSPDEQALAVRTGEGVVVITGCAHPGVVTMARAAQQAVGGDLALVMGGFHLEDAGEAEIERTIEGLRALGVQRVAPSHCTGDRARQLLAEEFGDACLQAGAGWSMVLGLPPDA